MLNKNGSEKGTKHTNEMEQEGRVSVIGTMDRSKFGRGQGRWDEIGGKITSENDRPSAGNKPPREPFNFRHLILTTHSNLSLGVQKK